MKQRPIYRGERIDSEMPAEMKKGHIPKGWVYQSWSTDGSENEDMARKNTVQAQRRWGGVWKVTRQDWQTMKVTDTGWRVGG